MVGRLLADQVDDVRAVESCQVDGFVDLAADVGQDQAGGVDDRIAIKERRADSKRPQTDAVDRATPVSFEPAASDQCLE